MSTVTNCVVFEDSNVHSPLFSDSALSALWQETDSILHLWNNRFTTDSVNSEIFALNHRQVQKLPISDDLYQMLRFIKEFNQKHPGLFDPTIGPLKEFWRPTCRKCTEPLLSSPETEDAINRILPTVDFSSVLLHSDKNKHTLQFTCRETQIEIGGIAKGFILNKLKEYFRHKGYKHFVISMGGDVFSTGGKPSGVPFTLGIQHPDNPTELITTFKFREGAVVTSGNYERYRIDRNGDRIHHIYSPTTGYPSTENKSLTIVTQDPTLADVYSTALFSLTADSILTIVNNNPELECFIVDRMGVKYNSEGFFTLTK